MKKDYKSLELPDSKECAKIMAQSLSTTQQEAVMKSTMQQHGLQSAVRTAEYNGHQIEIKTTYEIKIDGKPFSGHVMVDDNGNLHCHSIPYETYGKGQKCF